MADSPKRKKLEKTIAPEPKTSQRFHCCRCGVAYSRQKGYFSVSHSPMYRGSGYLPVCNDCLESMFEQYAISLGGNREAMKRICMKMDLYWNDAIYDMVEKSAGLNSKVKNYVGRTNLLRYVDKTYDDTIAEESVNGSVNYANAVLSEVKDNEGEGLIEIQPEIVDFWGPGFAPAFYVELEKKYKEWTNGESVTDPSQRALYKQICMLEVTIARDTAQGKSADKNITVLNNLLGSMNLKPTQKKEDMDAALEGKSFGELIRKYENEKPIPEPDPELQDVDHIVRYISIWFLGHLCKMLGIRNTYCKLYEDEIQKMRIERPEYMEEDDESLFNDIFGDSNSNSD